MTARKQQTNKESRMATLLCDVTKHSTDPYRMKCSINGMERCLKVRPILQI